MQHLILVFLFLFVSFSIAAQPIRQECEVRPLMATPFTICVYSEESKSQTQAKLHKAFERINDIELWMSEWIEDSQMSQINSLAGVRPVRVKREFYELFEWVLDLSKASQGAFDPSFNAFFGLYRFQPGQHSVPTEKQIQARLPLINYKNIVLNPVEQTVFLKKKGMKIGFGGIGQGYAVDRAAKILKQHFKAGFVDGSGDTYFWGTKPNGLKWITDIRDPRRHDRVVARIYGTDFAITTAGDDEKFFMKNGKRYHHIINPKTGRPARKVRQVTVISNTALVADGLDTAAFVLGPAKGAQLVAGYGAETVIVTDEQVLVSKGLHENETPWGEVLELK